MRGTSLATLLLMLKAELRVTLDTTSTANDDLYTRLLNNKQYWFTATADWPFLNDEWSISVSSRWTAAPTTNTRGVASSINYERPVRVVVQDGIAWALVECGIGPEEYNSVDPVTGEPQDPIYRYQFVNNSTASTDVPQIEVWPVPDTQQEMRIFGQRQTRLISGTQGAELDDLLLVLHVAAEELAARGSKDAQAKAVMAQQRFQQVRQNYPAYTSRLVLGGMEEDVRTSGRQMLRSYVPHSGGGGSGTTPATVQVYYYAGLDPNGNVSAVRPSLCYTSDGQLWYQTSATASTTGWVQMIGGGA